jgi:phosphate transport system ATP-binding protein
MIKNDNKIKIDVKNLNLYYGTNQALFDIKYLLKINVIISSKAS